MVARTQGEAEAKLRSLVGEAALTRVSRMKEKFHDVFALDEHGMPRWVHSCGRGQWVGACCSGQGCSLLAG